MTLLVVDIEVYIGQEIKQVHKTSFFTFLCDGFVVSWLSFAPGEPHETLSQRQ